MTTAERQRAVTLPSAADALRLAREQGQPALQAWHFHQRAEALAALGRHLAAQRDTLAEAALAHGAAETRLDLAMDLDLGLAVLRRAAATVLQEWPVGHQWHDGPAQPLDRADTRWHARLLGAPAGVVLLMHASATPCADLLLDLTVACLAGQPCVLQGAPMAQVLAEAIHVAGVLPPGALQHVADGSADVLARLASTDRLVLRGLHAVPPPGVAVELRGEGGGLALLDASVAPGSAGFEAFVRELRWSRQVFRGRHEDAVRRVLVPRVSWDGLTRALTPEGHSDAFALQLQPVDSLEEAIARCDQPAGGLARLACDDGPRRVQLARALAQRHRRVRLLASDSAPADAMAWAHEMAAAAAQDAMAALRERLVPCLVTGPAAAVADCLGEYLPGAPLRESALHPFRRHFDEIAVGDSLLTLSRTVTEADIAAFGSVSGDFFYMHFDAVAAARSPFGQRIAHGYFVLSAAAGLFVWPGEGPVLANYGIDALRFIRPVFIGDTLQARLTCKRKTDKPDRPGQRPQGVVSWDVLVTNQRGEAVARYDVLTLVAKTGREKRS